MSKRQNRKKQILKYLGDVGIAIISISLMTSPVLAVDSAKVTGQVIGAEGSTQYTSYERRPKCRTKNG